MDGAVKVWIFRAPTPDAGTKSPRPNPTRSASLHCPPQPLTPASPMTIACPVIRPRCRTIDLSLT